MNQPVMQSDEARIEATWQQLNQSVKLWLDKNCSREYFNTPEKKDVIESLARYNWANSGIIQAEVYRDMMFLFDTSHNNQVITHIVYSMDGGKRLFDNSVGWDQETLRQNVDWWVPLFHKAIILRRAMPDWGRSRVIHPTLEREYEQAHRYLVEDNPHITEETRARYPMVPLSFFYPTPEELAYDAKKYAQEQQAGR